MDVSKNRGKKPKMDGENKGKPYFLMDDLGGLPIIFGLTPYEVDWCVSAYGRHPKGWLPDSNGGFC